MIVNYSADYSADYSVDCSVDYSVDYRLQQILSSSHHGLIYFLTMIVYDSCEGVEKATEPWPLVRLTPCSNT